MADWYLPARRYTEHSGGLIMIKRLFPVILAQCAMMISCSDDSVPHKDTPADPPVCEGEECEIPGPVDKPCTGEGCETPCTSEVCETPCTGEGCETPCTGEGCETPCTGEGCETQDPGKQCEDDCTLGEKKCDEASVMVCQTGENGCLGWVVSQTCTEEQFCDDTLFVCGQCEAKCTGGEKRCETNGVSECTPDVHGCAVWNTVEICKENEHCDETDLKCVLGCADQCEAGQTRCNGQTIETCKTSEEGCLNWKATETCDFGKVCTGDVPKCEYACGDDCDPFSLVLIPDTQYYLAYIEHKKANNHLYPKQMQWIADHKDSENIRFVMHMGDVVNSNLKAEYVAAQEAQKKISDVGIPYSISTGNHEYKQGDSTNKSPARSRSFFADYFNDEFMKKSYQGKDLSWFHGFKYGHSMYATFNVGNLKFAVLALEYAPRKDVLCWADNLISTELKDHYVILTTHAYLQSNGRGNNENEIDESKYKYFNGVTTHYGDKKTYLKYTPFGASGDDVYRELAARHSNVILVAGGHFCEIASRNRKGYNGNMIHETVVDFQCERPCLSGGIATCCTDNDIIDNGNGWIRILTIDPKNTLNSDGTLAHNVTAKTVSTFDNYQKAGHLYCGDNDIYHESVTGSDHSYTFAIDFSKTIEYKYSNNNDISFGDRDINSVSDGNQNVPAVAVNRTTGAFVAVWENEVNGEYDIAGRIFCAGGCQDVKEFAVNTTTSGPQRHPDVAMDKDGNFVVVWEDDFENDGTYQIYMRGFDAKGKERFATKTVNSEAAGQQYTPSVAMAEDGRFVVAWEDQSVSKDTPQVYIRGFNADGTEMFHDRNTMDTVSGTRRSPDVAMAPDGRFVVTWSDDTDGNGVYQIYAKGFNADGTDRIKHFTVNKVDTGQQYSPSVAMNAAGDFYIVYDDKKSDTDHHINARGFDASGKEIFADQAVSDKDKLDSDPRPVVCLADDRSAVFGWKAMVTASEDNEHGDIRRNRADASGKLKGIAKAHYNNVGDQASPALGCTAKGKHVIIYSDDVDGNGYTEAMGRGYNGI